MAQYCIFVIIISESINLSIRLKKLLKEEMVVVAKPKLHYAWWIMVSCGSLSFGITGIVMSCMGIFLAPVCEDLGFQRGSFSFYITLMWLVMVVVLPLAGKSLPKGNSKLKLAASLAVFTLTFAAMSQFTQLYHWYIGAVLLGISGAYCMFLPIPMLINTWFKKKVGTAMGISMAMSGISGMIFNPIGAWAIQNHGWRTAYMILGISAAVITLLFVIFIVKFKPEEKGLKPYGADEIDVSAQQPGTPADLPGATARQAFRSPAFYTVVLYAATMLMSASMQSHLPGYVTSIGLSTMIGGTTMSVTALGIMLGKLALGVLNDKLGVGKTILIASTIGVGGIVLVLVGKTTVPLLYLGTFLFGFGIIAMATVQPPMVVRHFFGQKEYGVIFSNVTSGSTFFNAFSATIYGIVYDRTGVFANSMLLSLVFIIASYILFTLTRITAKGLLDKKTVA